LLGGGYVKGRSGLFSSFSVVLACVLKATTKKIVNFLRNTCIQRKSWKSLPMW